MKKLFTLIAAALMTIGASAQTYLIAVDSYPWNYEVVEYPAETQLSFGQWGQFILATGVDLSQYKGVKVEYTGDASTATAEGWVNVKYGDGTDPNSTSYGLDANKTETTVEFEEARKTITSGQLAIQGAVANAKILLKSVKLIAADGTETAIASYPGSGQNLWNVSPFIAGGKINFKGQYGGLRIVDAEGKDITYTNDGTDTDKREIVFTFGSALEAEGLIFELNDAAGGFNWLNIDKGIESYTLTLSPETVGSKDDAGNFTAKNLVKLYMKAGAASGYPMAVDIKSIAAPAEEPATKPVMISWGASDIAAKGTLNGKTFGDDFKLTITDTTDDGKLSIDENSAYFGDADNQIKFTHRLKTGGKSDSKNNMTLTIPSDGTLKVYVRTGSNSATDRNLVLSQSGTELYNKVVLESDAVKVKGLDTKEPDKETNVYPIISVSVKAGTVDVTYPTNSLNFYGFEFIGTTGIQETIAPAKVISNGAIYNLAGQKVNESYKGIVIKNGKKYIQK